MSNVDFKNFEDGEVPDRVIRGFVGVATCSRCVGFQLKYYY
jgi:hypothetical protein